MSLNKHQFERLNLLHDLFQKGGIYSVEELLEILKERIIDKNHKEGLAIGISRKTLLNDIKYLRSKGAPIPPTKKYYYNANFSFLEVLGTTDLALLQELKSIVAKLQTFNKINQILDVNLDEVALRISPGNSKTVLFDHNVEHLANSEFLPELLNHIQNKRALEIVFIDFKDKVYKDIFHPYLLKEYNGRWYVYGLSENQYEISGFKQIYHYPIDRIRRFSVLKKSKLSQIDSNWWNADSHFRDLIGVTKYEGAKPQSIMVRIYDSSVDYLQTKKLHHSQEAINVEDDYTDFSFFVIDNYEFRSKILALGSNAEVLEPEYLRKEFAEITEKMRERYLE
jgi:predicted DNA-binding transcriptional regulator YafY